MTPISSLPPAAVFFLGAFVLPFLPRRLHAGVFLLFPVLGLVFLLQLNPGTTLVFQFLDYELVVSRVDRLSLAFGYVFTIIAFLGGIYGYSLKKPGEEVAALLYAGSALGVVFAGDLFTLFVFWELMAVSSVYLIWARRTVRSSQAGMRYLLVHLFGGSVLLAGILWHLGETGSILFNHLEGGPAAYLILFGFAVNAAVPPLHAWLSDSYPEATVAGAVFLSAFTTKTAVYALARGFAGWEILMWAGAIMALYGVVFAVLENDIRRLLSYHIISQVGFMVAGVGLGTEAAINGATAHAFAHILYKGLLFMGAGAVLHTTGRSKMTELGGLARSMPLVLSLYMVGAFSISGVPLFSGFVSKSLVLHAAELSHRYSIFLLLSLASVGTFLSLGLKLPYFTWFGAKKSFTPAPAPLSMVLGMVITAGINVAIGVYPDLLYDLLPFPLHYRPYTLLHVTGSMQLLFFTWLGFWFLIDRLSGEATITLDTDWFYRRPSRFAYRLMVVPVNRLFMSLESLTLGFSRSLARVSLNPVGYLLVSLRSVLYLRGAGDERLEPSVFDPDQYRLPVGIVVLVVLLCFMGLLAWNLFSF